MKISNIRLGFACNSSSVHSVVVYKNEEKPQDALCEESEFGWAPFVASSTEAKRRYLRTLLVNRLREMPDTALRVADSLFGTDPTEGPYIDHQSIPLLPRKYGSADLDYAFLKEFMDFILRGDVAIHGGNDNGDASPPESNAEWFKQLPRETQENEWVCKKEGDWWILFHTRSGDKVTLSFKDNPNPRRVSEVPELIDLKITEVCPFGCKFCYQNSTHQGHHADNILDWLYVFRKAGVFEVAIGGGEPTVHPEFKDILGSIRRDLQINFSTRNLDWVLYNADLIKESHAYFAFSVGGESISLNENAIVQIKKADLNFSVQYVMKTMCDEYFIDLVEFCTEEDIPLTLLGYKNIGRGATALKLKGTVITNQLSDSWIQIVKDKGYFIGIDTALAQSVPIGTFPENMLRRTEGTHSMFIDAVTNRAGVSSYTEQPFVDVTPQSFIEVFHTLHREFNLFTEVVND